SRHYLMQDFSPHHRPPPFPYTTIFRSGHLSKKRVHQIGDHESDGARLAGHERACRQIRAVVQLPHSLANSFTRMRELNYRPNLRSEEHTSELQSLRHLVCRLLLEKKK